MTTVEREYEDAKHFLEVRKDYLATDIKNILLIEVRSQKDILTTFVNNYLYWEMVMKALNKETTFDVRPFVDYLDKLKTIKK